MSPRVRKNDEGCERECIREYFGRQRGALYFRHPCRMRESIFLQLFRMGPRVRKGDEGVNGSASETISSGKGGTLVPSSLRNA